MKLWKRNKANQSSVSNNTIEVLAPIALKKEPHSAYHCVEELRKALSHPDCYNIALTGVYGSGKSSVLKTLLKEDGNKYHYLKISLSSLLLDIKEDENYENGIESKIFQQILFKVNHEKTPKSKYSRSRIKHFSFKSTLGIALFCVLFFLSFIIVFEPEYLQVSSLYVLYDRIFSTNIGYWVNIIGDVVACIYMLSIIAFGLAQLIRCTCNISLKSIKAKDITFDFDKGKSAFKELLGEILYFFKAGGYNLVIFEDLDRITKPQSLFLKFREINQLLNESDDFRKNGNRIQFLYAIRDDVFTEDVRTKFFDYMVPVVPVIDKFNAGDYLIKNYKQNGLAKINDKEIYELGLYISTTRELINIMNEYRVYKDILIEGSMSQKKMLASIIYKNRYPKDYSLFHEKRGSLYGVLSNKSTFLELLTEVDIDLKNDIALKVQLDEQIKEIRGRIVSNRNSFLNWLKDDQNVLRLIVDEASYSINEVAEKDDLFSLFENDKFDNFQKGDEGGIHEYTFKFIEILNAVDPDGTLFESMKDNQRSFRKYRSQLYECSSRLRLTNTKCVKDLIHEIGDGRKTLDIVKQLCDQEVTEMGLEAPTEQVELIHAFVKNGYIEEDFDAYLTYTYPGSKSRADFEFLHSVSQGVGKPYNYKLDHTEEIIKTLHTGNYSSKEILNFDLLEGLIKMNDNTLLQTYFTTIRKNLDFVVQYYETGRIGEKFKKILFNNWDNCIDQIINQLNEDSTVLFELLFSVADQSGVLRSNEKSILNEKYSYLCESIDKFDTTRLIGYIGHHSLKFTHLVTASESTMTLFNYVIQNSYFEINRQNLNVIYGEDFKTRSYTAITNGLTKVKDYLLDNIVVVVELFPDTDVNEDASAISELSYIDKVSDDRYEAFLKRQENNLQDFNGIKVERIPLFFKHNKIAATWTNIQDYFKASDDAFLIRDFILKHIDDLVNKKIEESDDKFLQLFLMGDNNFLSIDAFRALLPSCDYLFSADEIDPLNEERLKIIIETDYIEYTVETKELFASKSPELFGDFLVHFFDEFQDDETFVEDIPNKTGLYILNSNLTLDQKKYFLDNSAVFHDGSDIEEYSRLICSYYGKMVVDDNTNVDMLISAMNFVTDPIFWKQKIDIINNINYNRSYDRTKETSLLDALGGEYLKLSTYRGVAYLDMNEENKNLLDYLQDQGHFVNRIIEVEGQYKVTFKNPPQGL